LVVFVGMLLVAVMTFPNSKLDTAAVVLSTLQQAAQILGQAGPSLPEPFRSIGPYASIITFDLFSVRPECSALQGSLHFYSSLLAACSLLVCLVPLVALASLLRALHGRWKRSKARLAFQMARSEGQPEVDDDKQGQAAAVTAGGDGGLLVLAEQLNDSHQDGALVNDRGPARTLWTLFFDRLVRAATILLFLFYLRLTTNSLVGSPSPFTSPRTLLSQLDNRDIYELFW